MSNDHVSWLAPPDKRFASITPVAPLHHDVTLRASSSATEAELKAYLPVNLAGRFSRNAATPSLKSGDAPAIR